MLGAQSLCAGRDLYRATPAVTRDLGFFQSHPKDRPIQTSLTTHQDVWRIYSNRDRQEVKKLWRQICQGRYCTVIFSSILCPFRRLIGYLRFYVPLKNILVIWRRHHCRWRLQNLGLCSALALGPLSREGYFRATPAVTRDLVFFRLIRRTAPFSRLLRHTRGCGGPILTRILTEPLPPWRRRGILLYCRSVWQKFPFIFFALVAHIEMKFVADFSYEYLGHILFWVRYSNFWQRFTFCFGYDTAISDSVMP
jgi:hypothetical protein